VSESFAEVGRLLVEIAGKISDLFVTLAKEVWSLSVEAVLLLSHWMATGFSYARQWSIIAFKFSKAGALIGWKYSSAFAVKAFWASVHTSHIGLIYLRNFLSTYRAEITIAGISVFSTLLLTYLVSLLPKDRPARRT
jgi:hypothetical protein